MRLSVFVSWEEGSGRDEEAVWRGRAARWPGWDPGRPGQGGTLGALEFSTY